MSAHAYARFIKQACSHLVNRDELHSSSKLPKLSINSRGGPFDQREIRIHIILVVLNILYGINREDGFLPGMFRLATCVVLCFFFYLFSRKVRLLGYYSTIIMKFYGTML